MQTSHSNPYMPRPLRWETEAKRKATSYEVIKGAKKVKEEKQEKQEGVNLQLAMPSLLPLLRGQGW
jgi:hypothetical protein